MKFKDLCEIKNDTVLTDNNKISLVSVVLGKKVIILF